MDDLLIFFAEGDEEDDDTSEAIVDSKDMQLTAEL